MTIEPTGFLEAIKAKNSIDANDTLALRKAMWPDGRISESEANILFELNDASSALSREWIDFFCEAIGEYVVNQTEPKGYVSEANADWLIVKVDHDGKLDSLAEMELLAKVVEKASNTPGKFKAYILDQVEKIVLTGEGPTRDGGAVLPGCITKAEADYLRRIIFASGGDGPARVSRSEADMLFRLKDASLGGDNAPEWKKLFVQSVGNFLMAYNDFQPLTRGRAERLENFMDDDSVSIGGFLKRMAGSNIKGAFGDVFGKKDAGPTHEEKVAEDRNIDMAENDWLAARIDADHNTDELEKALLKFVAEESGVNISR